MLIFVGGPIFWMGGPGPLGPAHDAQSVACSF